MMIFVIDSQTRAIASMLEATEFIMSGRKVVLVVKHISAGHTIDGEVQSIFPWTPRWDIGQDHNSCAPARAALH